MRPGETQIVIRHELRAGGSSDPVAAIPGAFPAAQLPTFIHQDPISLRLCWNGEKWDNPVVPGGLQQRRLPSESVIPRYVIPANYEQGWPLTTVGFGRPII